tara:strand:+ start:28121 stop:28369 length:249 start_codon:yes stop_codon:yes gene_type:complete
VIWIFYDSKKPWGWLVSGISVVALILGVVMKMRLTMSTVNAFDMALMLTCMFGGFGMFLASLKKTKDETRDKDTEYSKTNQQ